MAEDLSMVGSVEWLEESCVESWGARSVLVPFLFELRCYGRIFGLNYLTPHFSKTFLFSGLQADY